MHADKGSLVYINYLSPEAKIKSLNWLDSCGFLYYMSYYILYNMGFTNIDSVPKYFDLDTKCPKDLFYIFLVFKYFEYNINVRQGYDFKC